MAATYAIPSDSPLLEYALTLDRSNILAVPFRKSTQISLTTAIRQYISTKYDQHPDMFRHDIEVIENLRRDAVNVREPHQSGIKKLQIYAGQLVWMTGKFPIDVRPFSSSRHLLKTWKADS